jgi:hypothetical protein
MGRRRALSEDGERQVALLVDAGVRQEVAGRALGVSRRTVVRVLGRQRDAHRELSLAELVAREERDLAAITAFRDACQRIGDALTARGWIGAGVDAGTFDHLPVGVWTGSVAPSSRRRTANGDPLTVDEIFGFVVELGRVCGLRCRLVGRRRGIGSRPRRDA